MKGFKIFTGNSTLDFARKVAKNLRVNLNEPGDSDRKGRQICWLSNVNCMVDIKQNVRDYHCFVFQTQSESRVHLGKNENGQDIFGKGLGVSDHIVESFVLINALATSGAKVTLVLPYMPYIRSDKKDHPRVAIGARLMADLYQTAGATGILLMDPHFSQIHGFFDEKVIKVEVLRAKPILAKALKSMYQLSADKFVVVAPDANEAKHAGSMATILNLKMAIIDKRRYGDNEKAKPENLMGEEYVRGRKVLMFDDEAASAETLIESAKFLVDKGAQSIIALPTHGVFSSMENLKIIGESPLFEKIITTNTIFLSEEKKALCPKIMQIDVSSYFAEAVRILYAGESLDKYKRSLYDGLGEVD